MPQDYERELQVAIDAVRQAAELCRAVQSEITPEVLAKKDRSPVTVADFGSQAIICRAVHSAFPNDPIVAEEDSSDLAGPENAAVLDQVLRRVQAQGIDVDARRVCEWIDRGHTRSFSDRFWTLDPIDGTKGFLRGEQYAVSLALIVRGTIELGVLGCPNLPFDAAESRGAIFVATRGHGARALPFHGTGTGIPIRVSTRADAEGARFCESVESGHSSHGDAAALANRLQITTPPLRMDSQAKYAVVARGEAEFYLRLPTRADYREKIWDHAGGMILVTEAGGTVTDITGKPLEFTHGSELVENQGVIVSNGRWHDRLLSALSTGREGDR
jgi:HAL2 family 3'(2'),5'-bisphosphate nucleotidase